MRANFSSSSPGFVKTGFFLLVLFNVNDPFKILNYPYILGSTDLTSRGGRNAFSLKAGFGLNAEFPPFLIQSCLAKKRVRETKSELTTKRDRQNFNFVSLHLSDTCYPVLFNNCTWFQWNNTALKGACSEILLLFRSVIAVVLLPSYLLLKEGRLIHFLKYLKV